MDFIFCLPFTLFFTPPLILDITIVNTYNSPKQLKFIFCELSETLEELTRRYCDVWTKDL